MIKGTYNALTGNVSGVATGKHGDWITITLCLAIIAVVTAQIIKRMHSAGIEHARE